MPSRTSELALAVESCHKHCSLALAEISKTQTTNVIVLQGKGQDAQIFPALQKLCHARNSSVRQVCADLRLLATIRGPGSFTGLRMSASLLNALALSLPSKPSIYAPDVFQVLASCLSEKHLSSNILFLPASLRRDFYWKLILDQNPSPPQNTSCEVLWENHLKSLAQQKRPLILVGEDAPRLLSLLPAFPNHWACLNVTLITQLWSNLQKLSINERDNLPKRIDPFYLRAADVTIAQ